MSSRLPDEGGIRVLLSACGPYGRIRRYRRKCDQPPAHFAGGNLVGSDFTIEAMAVALAAPLALKAPTQVTGGGLVCAK